jgi:competence protein ComEA
VPRRLALAAVLLAALAAPRLRTLLETPAGRVACVPEGRGIPPRHWLGCAADPGPARGLASDERLALGLPIDPNVAGTRELAFVPGLSRHLAEQVVRDREINGRYECVQDLLRVRGVGPKKLASASPHLRVEVP